MGRSVEILKEILETEKGLIAKYRDALEAMAHPESKATVQKILEGKDAITKSIEEIVANSSKCPAMSLSPEAREMMKNYNASGDGAGCPVPHEKN